MPNFLGRTVTERPPIFRGTFLLLKRGIFMGSKKGKRQSHIQLVTSHSSDAQETEDSHRRSPDERLLSLDVFERRRLPRYEVDWPAWVRLATEYDAVGGRPDSSLLAKPQARILDVSRSGLKLSVPFVVLADLMAIKNRADWRTALPALVRFRLSSRQIVSVVCGIAYVRRTHTDRATVGVVFQRFIFGALAFQTHLQYIAETVDS